ncbi:type II toxin-antitoxin system PemK/MazF family toxin [Microbacterium sp.]|uniref:type II toxin-antitoxin system PemK/MazF family toxin n=1 Tax=Microbacterium sp. TaxID=51671 RepID=UPI003C7149D8
MVSRADIHWAYFGAPTGSVPAKRRPVLIVQANEYSRSRLGTVIVATITSNTALAAMPGNVFLPSATTGLPRDSVVNVTALATVDRRVLDTYPIGRVPALLMNEVENGLQRVLGLH